MTPKSRGVMYNFNAFKCPENHRHRLKLIFTRIKKRLSDTGKKPLSKKKKLTTEKKNTKRKKVIG